MSDFTIFYIVFGVSLVIAGIGYVFLPKRDIWEKYSVLVPVSIYFFFALYYIGIGCVNLWSFNTGGDLPIFVDIFTTTLKGQFMLSTIEKGSYNFLGHHFSPILILCIPFFWLWQSPYTLIIIQGLVFTAGALLLYLIARDKTKSVFFSGSLMIGYLLAPLQLEDLMTDFHMDYFTPFFILCSIYFLNKRKMIPHLISLFLLLACKVDTFVYAGCIGLYAFFFLKERKIGLAAIALTVLYTGLAMGVIRPALMGGPAGHHNWILKRYKYLGDGFSSMLSTVIFRPQTIIQYFFEYNFALKMRSLCFIFIPVIFLPLISGGILIMLVPAMMLMLLSSHWAQNSMIYHYSVTIYVFTFVAAVYGGGNIIKRYQNKITNVLGVFIIAAGVMTHFSFSTWTPSLLFDVKPYFEIGEIKSGYEMLKKIPKEASITSRCEYAVHLFKDNMIQTIKVNSMSISADTDYILIDKKDRDSLHFLNILYEKEYGIKDYDNYFVLLKRGYGIEKTNDAFKKIFGRIEGEKQLTKRGKRVLDRDASNDWAIYSDVGDEKHGTLAYGPYRKFPEGKYKAVFFLKIDNNKIKDKVCSVDVASGAGENILAKLELTGTDFSVEGQYISFELEFVHNNADSPLEVRVYFYDKSNLWLDVIEVSSPSFNLDEFWKLNVGEE